MSANWKLVIDGLIHCEVLDIVMDGAVMKYPRRRRDGQMESVSAQVLELSDPVFIELLDQRVFQVLIDDEILVPLEVFESSENGLEISVLPNPE